MSSGSRALVLALGLAGCGFELSGGAPDDAGVDADSDAAIDAALDAFVDPDRDDDGDGLTNGNDNCPAVVNLDQLDHDNDAKGDACDRCPHLPGPDPDGDGDGIGDACDPRPTNGQDQRVLWTGFDDASAITGWNGAGTWVVMGGTLRQNSTSGATGWAPPMTVNRAFVMTELIVGTLGSPSNTPQIGIAGGTAGSNRYSCTVTRTTAGTSIRAQSMWSDSGGNGNQSGETDWSPNTFATGSRATLTQDLGDEHLCRGVQGTQERTRTVNAGSNPAGRVYLGTQAAAAQFDYLFIVEMP